MSTSIHKSISVANTHTYRKTSRDMRQLNRLYARDTRQTDRQTDRK